MMCMLPSSGDQSALYKYIYISSASVNRPGKRAIHKIPSYTHILLYTIQSHHIPSDGNASAPCSFLLPPVGGDHKLHLSTKSLAGFSILSYPDN